MNTTHGQPPSVAAIRATLRGLMDPEVGLNVVDLGMIGKVTVADDGAVIIEMLPTTPGCPMHGALANGVQRLVGDLPGVSAVEVHFVHTPPWTPDRIAPETRALLGWR